MKRQLTINEFLYLVLKAQFYGRSHLHYVPAKAEHLEALKKCKSLGYVTLMTPGGSIYKVTRKGRAHLLKANSETFKELDAQINEFVDKL
jgi:hypothetical protein